MRYAEIIERLARRQPALAGTDDAYRWKSLHRLPSLTSGERPRRTRSARRGEPNSRPAASRPLNRSGPSGGNGPDREHREEVLCVSDLEAARTSMAPPVKGNQEWGAVRGKR